MNKGQFDGSRPGPGRPKGFATGRTKALYMLDQLLAKAENQQALERAFQAAFDKNPVRFFLRVVMPLMPRTALAVTQDATGIRWTSLLETYPAEIPPARQS